jgi:hypothetical protein
VQQYLAAQNIRIRAIYDNLFKTTKCGKCSSCCIGTANAIADSGVGFVTLAVQAALSLGLSLAQLSVILNPANGQVITGFEDTIVTILAGSKCAPVTV